MSMFVKIVRRPIGEAPEWVRDAWIGVRLPLLCKGRITTPGFGVVSGPHNLLGQLWALIRGREQRWRGYVVNARTAVDLLAEQNPTAAQWWRQNVPVLLNGRRNFIFDEEACELSIISGTQNRESAEHRQ